MPRLLSAVRAIPLLLLACSNPEASSSARSTSEPPMEASSRAPSGAPPTVDAKQVPAAVAPPAGAVSPTETPPRDGGVSVDPSRRAEARALVPAPLLYGQFQPVVGQWVEYELATRQGAFRVRVALVGETVREDGTPLYQVELDHETTPRMLVVVWLAGATRPFVERLAVSVAPHAPISIPVDLEADSPELRGELMGEKDITVRGPFAGKARERTFRRERGKPVVVVDASRVPLVGVVSVVTEDGSWVVRASGTGARPSLDTVPIAIPRLPGQ
ncbi:hypothetical protein HUW62_37050 [Myxococcus sp. AM011]|uniref:hypothetical protein n=1 Tax=Myxococcus sp. AM011 TaxID=2745200 RepID=UPI0015959EB7|nr:hypothetical protein [Myxococcus sp. AM011]NVJ26842.1 hypothetical protein [Myxococcus sp. AM011]